VTTLQTDTLRAISADSYEWDSEAEGNVGASKGRGFIIVRRDAPVKDILLANGRPGAGSPVLAEVWLEARGAMRINFTVTEDLEGIDPIEFSGLLERAENELCS